MAFNKEIEKVKAQIKVLEKKLSFLEEIEKQPKMTLANSGEFDVVSYNYKLYYRFEYPDSDNFSWYKTQDVPKGYVTGVFEPVTDAETERLLEGLYYNYIQVKKEKEQQTKSPAEEAYKDWWGEYPTNTWQVDVNRWVAFQAGYNASKEEKVSETAQERGERVHKDVERCVRESVKWGEKNKPPTLYEKLEEWVDYGNFAQSKDVLVNEIVNIVKDWLLPEHDSNDYRWNKCIKMMKENLR